MDIYNLKGVLHVNALVNEAVLDRLEADLRAAGPFESLNLEHDGEMLEIGVMSEASHGSANNLDRVVEQFARQYAIRSSLFDSDYGGTKNEIPMLSSIDIASIEALLDDGLATEDAATGLGRETDYLGGGIWQVDGRGLDRVDMRAFLTRAREEEIRSNASAESNFLPPFVAETEPAPS